MISDQIILVSVEGADDMASAPQISVIIAAYNEGRHIDRCLRSLASQVGAPSFEVIVVDDGSTDNTLEVVGRFSELLDLKIVSNDSNQGIGAAGAVGVAAASGRFLVRVDGDDYVSEHFLSVLYLAASAPGSDPAYRCDYFLVDENAGFLKRCDAAISPIACGLVMSRESVISVGSYNSEKKTGEDVDFEKRYRKSYSIGHIPIPLYRYRKHLNNTSGARRPE